MPTIVHSLTSSAPPPRSMNRRSSYHYLAAAVGAASLVSCSSVADAFTSTSTPTAKSLSVTARRPQRSSITARTTARRDNVDDDNDEKEFTSIIARPLFTAVTSAFLATSLLFSSSLLPTPDALAADATATTTNTRSLVTDTATSIDIDLSSLPALTRKAIVNREKLTNYLIESIKSFKPILDLLSESDAVTVTPPKNVKAAINQALTKGDAQFLVNGEAVDVRIESVPGVIVIRVINPHIPRLQFLRDGTAAIQFVDSIVDAAPEQLEKAAEEVQNIGKFLSWGAPDQAPIRYRGSSLDKFLSSKFMVNGNTVSLGSFLGDLTNSEVVLLVVGTGVGGAYTASYAYYVSSNEKAERDALEAKEKKALEAAAKKKAKAEEDAKKAKAEAIAAAAETTAEYTAPAAELDGPVNNEAKVDVAETIAEVAVVNEPTSDEESAPSDEKAAKADTGKKRNIVQDLFRRGK